MIGQKPNLFRLQEQQYNIMAEDYKRVNLEQEFPLLKFSEKVYQMRLEDRTTLPEEECIKEFQTMERYKMVIRREYDVDAQGNVRREYFFRHDKIMEYFIVQTFLGQDNDKPQKHLGDPRFSGVYFLLATLMPIEDAEVLRKLLTDYAADTKDHTVSDTFIQLLRPR